jgi:hypothetical protein
LISGNGECDLTYRNFAVVNDANGLRIGTVVGDTVDCVGDTNGVITLYSEFWGIPPYMYAFSTSPFGYNRAHDNLAAGYYRVSLRDSVGCIADTAIRIKSPDPILTTYDIDYPSCDGTVLGSISIDSIKGGWGEYEYTWNGILGSDSLNDIEQDSDYILMIRDAKECFVTDTISIDSCEELASIEGQLDINEFAVYPNPAIGKAFIVASSNIIESISLYNLTGQLIEQFQISDYRFQIELNHQMEGIYFLKLEDIKGIRFTEKIVVN